MSIIATIGQYFNAALIPITAAVTVRRTSENRYSIDATATLNEPATEVVGASISVANFDSIGGTGLLQIGINRNQVSGNRSGNFTVQGDAATSGDAFDIVLTAGNISAGYEYVNLPMTVNVPAFLGRRVITITPSFVSRTIASTVRLQFRVQIVPTVNRQLQFFIIGQNARNNLANQNILVTIPRAQSVQTNFFNVTGVQGTNAFQITVNSTDGEPNNYNVVFTNTTINVPAFAPQTIDLTVDISATRTSTTGVRYVAFVTADRAVATTISFVVQLINANSVQGTENLSFTITQNSMGSNTVTRNVSLFGTIVGNNNLPFSASLRESPSSPAPTGYQFANLPTIISIPAFN